MADAPGGRITRRKTSLAPSGKFPYNPFNPVASGKENARSHPTIEEGAVMNKFRWHYLVLSALVSALVLTAWSPRLCAQVVHFKDLMALLNLEPPPGWEVAEKPRGSTTKAPVQLSQAEVVFTSGEDKRLEIHIMDVPGAIFSYMGLAMAMEMESSEEYIKSVTIQGHKGMETYRFKDKEGEIQLPVADRFLVTVKGSGLDNTAILHALAAKLDLKKLASLAAN
jgi:hypothetical protein